MARGSSTGTEKRRRLDGCHSYASIQNHRAAGSDHEGIAIKFNDLWQVFNHRAHTQQSFFKRGHIMLRPAAKTIKQWKGLQAANHLGSIVSGKRREAYRDIAHQFDLNAARATGDNRPELWIMYDADEHLDASGDLSLEDEAVCRLPARL